MKLDGFVQSGSLWQPKAHRAEGVWRIDAQDDGLIFRLGTDFRTDPGPDVKLYLVTQRVQDIGVRDQLADSGAFVGLLKSFEGTQTYTLPDVHRFADFRAIMLHCERYSAVWCGVDIN